MGLTVIITNNTNINTNQVAGADSVRGYLEDIYETGEGIAIVLCFMIVTMLVITNWRAFTWEYRREGRLRNTRVLEITIGPLTVRVRTQIWRNGTWRNTITFDIRNPFRRRN